MLFTLRCLELNIPILQPIGNNLPYDFVIEYRGTLRKIQVKTAWIAASKDVATFNTKSTCKNFTEVKHKSYIGLIDYFAVVSQEHNHIALIPVEKVAKSCMSLYYGEYPRKRQNNAKDFTFSV